MFTLAVLNSAMSGQIKRDDEIGKVKISWVGTDLQILESKLPAIQPNAIAVDLESLSNDPIGDLAGIKKRSQSSTILITYAFAKWSLIDKFRQEGYRVVKAPISMRVLNANLLDLIVKSLSRDSDQMFSSMKRIKPKTFSKPELGKLQAIRSVVDCECPNHVADIVLSLGMFEDYSKDCKNKNEADAEIHKMLYEETAKARTIMEEALVKLCKHENIDVSKL